MTIIEMYEKVNLKLPTDQRKFFNYFNDTVDELVALYEDSVITSLKKYKAITDLTDDNFVQPLYHNAMVDNILFYLTNEPDYKSEFIRKSKEAWLKYWNERANGKRQRRMRW